MHMFCTVDVTEYDDHLATTCATVCTSRMSQGLPSYRESVCQQFPAFWLADYGEYQEQSKELCTTWRLELPRLCCGAQEEGRLKSAKKKRKS